MYCSWFWTYFGSVFRVRVTTAISCLEDFCFLDFHLGCQTTLVLLRDTNNKPDVVAVGDGQSVLQNHQDWLMHLLTV